jgi:coenzyme F420-reducing hydrogenase alpha subunit
MTRVEGRGRIEIVTDRKGVPEAHFRINDYRNFEKFLEGKMAFDIPRIVPKVCGMCSISHALASCKAIEKSLGIEITKTAECLRRLMLLIEIIRSHIVHVGYMILPDFNGISSTIRKEIVMNTLEFIRVCDNTIRTLSGKNIHPLNCIVGGISKSLNYEDRISLQKDIRKILQNAFWIQKEIARADIEEKDDFKQVNMVYMGLQKAGEISFYDGDLRVVDSKGNSDITFAVHDYSKFIKFSSKENFVFEGNKQLLAGPLARSNIGTYPSGRKIQQESKDFAIAATQIRLDEIIECLKEAEQLLGMSQLSSSSIRIHAETPNGRGIGAVEAPRGTLIHDFDLKDGYVKKARLLVPTEFNLGLMETVMNNVLKQFHDLSDPFVTERVKKAIRSFDPCISCLGA